MFFYSIWKFAVFEHIGFKAAISGEKNKLLHGAAGEFKAEGYSRAKDVICFRGKQFQGGVKKPKQHTG